MKNLIYYISTLLISTFLFSCEEEFGMEDSTAVLQSIVFEGQSPKIILSQTLDAFPEYPFNITYYDQPFYTYGGHANIEITVSSEGEIYNDFKMVWQEITKNYRSTPSATSHLKYFIDSSFIPEAGKEYKIEINEIPSVYGNPVGLDYLKSSTYIPTKVPIILNQQKDVINYNNQTGVEDSVIYNKVYNLSFNDPSNTNDYYYLTISKVISSDYFLMDTIDMDQIWLENATFNYTNVMLQSLNISHNDIISGLNADPYNKFSLLGTSTFLFNDEDFNGQTKNIQVELFNYGNEIEEIQYLVVELLHISKEYFDYYSTISTQSNSQLDIYSEPTQLYTNIENGIGVFAGASLSSDNIFIEPMP